jgi:hypothetical protein
MKTRSLFLICSFLASTFYLSGKDKNMVLYPASLIKESLKKDANAVCRNYEHEFELIDYGKAIEKVHIVITVLNENGDHFSKLMMPYDKSQKIKNISGQSYNELGLPDNKLKSSAIQDLNYTSSGAIYDDLRMKYAEFKTNIYPYTVEYEIVTEHNELIRYPEWEPLDEYRLSVEKSSFKLLYPESLKVRYKEFNLPVNCKTEKKENVKKSVEWKVDSLCAWKEEPMSPSLITYTPRVVLAPVTFTYHDTNGDMSSWKSLGEWCFGLSQGLDQLSEPRQVEIRNMIGVVKDTVSTIQTLYKYMQQRTRYVGIQLGLGGYKPFPAETVDKLGYGDCKALSNYMKALLNCVGIKSIYTLAGAGSNEGITMPDFPTINQNNHAILCVPLKKDTLWLECTSQTQACDYLGTFVRDRRVLLIKPEGGVFAKTPSLTANNNVQNRVANVKVNTDGSMQTEVKTRFTGYQYDNVSPQFSESKEDQKKELLEDFNIPGLVINSFSYDTKKERVPEAVETIAMNSPKYATKTGTRLFIPMNMLNQRKTSPAKVENRKMAVVQSYAYQDKDSIVFELPVGYTIESVPQQKTLTTEFGDYNSAVTVDKNKAIYVRNVKIKDGTWPKEKYQELVDFYSGIVLSDKAKLVLKVQ